MRSPPLTWLGEGVAEQGPEGLLCISKELGRCFSNANSCACLSQGQRDGCDSDPNCCRRWSPGYCPAPVAWRQFLHHWAKPAGTNNGS